MNLEQLTDHDLEDLRFLISNRSTPVHTTLSDNAIKMIFDTIMERKKQLIERNQHIVELEEIIYKRDLQAAKEHQEKTENAKQDCEEWRERD